MENKLSKLIKNIFTKNKDLSISDSELFENYEFVNNQWIIFDYLNHTNIGILKKLLYGKNNNKIIYIVSYIDQFGVPSILPFKLLDDYEVLDIGISEKDKFCGFMSNIDTNTYQHFIDNNLSSLLQIEKYNENLRKENGLKPIKIVEYPEEYEETEIDKKDLMLDDIKDILSNLKEPNQLKVLDKKNGTEVKNLDNTELHKLFDAFKNTLESELKSLQQNNYNNNINNNNNNHPLEDFDRKNTNHIIMKMINPFSGESRDINYIIPPYIVDSN
jgi:hypothetical protein